MIKTVLFDLDGTLIDTTGIIIEAFKMTFKKHFPLESISEDDYTNFLGQTLFKTFELYSSNQQKIDEAVSYYREVSNPLIDNGLKAFPKAVETLKYLKKKKITIGIVTSKMRSIATYHLELTNLIDYIDGIIGYEDSVNHKPDKEPIIKALDLFNAKTEETIYIGDHENDIKAAKNAGIESVAVTYSKRLNQMLSEQPNYVIDELNHLKDLI